MAQAIGRLGNYFNQELFGAPTTMPWGLDVFVRTPGGVAGAIPADGTCEFPTDYVKATPEVLCGTYQPTFLYELLWCLGVAALVVWADKRFTLGGGRAFALYVAGYTLGRVWIEMLRIDPGEPLPRAPDQRVHLDHRVPRRGVVPVPAPQRPPGGPGARPGSGPQQPQGAGR